MTEAAGAASAPQSNAPAVVDRGNSELGSMQNEDAVSQKIDWEGADIASVYDGRTCIGHFLNRARHEVSAFDANERHLGVFKNREEARKAIRKAASDVT